MKRLVMLAVAIGLFAGEVILAMVGPAVVRHQKGELPEREVVTEREVGDVVYSKFDYTETVGIRVQQGLEQKLLMRRIVLQPGDFLMTRETKKGTDHCSHAAIVSNPLEDDEMICFRDTNNDGQLDQLHIPLTAYGNWSKIKGSPIPFEPGTSLDASKGYRRELLFDGISGNVVRMSYREYIDNFARPAFQQDLTYTLEESGPTEVGFRGARLRIHSASNQAISYEVLAGLRD